MIEPERQRVIVKRHRRFPSICGCALLHTNIGESCARFMKNIRYAPVLRARRNNQLASVLRGVTVAWVEQRGERIAGWVLRALHSRPK
jgi:hypothetical protein